MKTWRKLAIRTAIASVVIAGATVTAVAAIRDGTGAASATPAPAVATLSAPTGIASGSGGSGATSHASFSAVERLAPPAVTNITPGYLSLPLRDLPPAVGPLVPRPESVEPPEGSYPSPPDQSAGFTDPVVQSIQAPNVMPAATSFDGLQNQNNVSIPSIANSARPPDSEGDVGPHPSVEWINLVMRVYDKS
jgi:hypothetical protein